MHLYCRHVCMFGVICVCVCLKERPISSVHICMFMYVSVIVIYFLCLWMEWRCECTCMWYLCVWLYVMYVIFASVSAHISLWMCLCAPICPPGRSLQGGSNHGLLASGSEVPVLWLCWVTTQRRSMLSMPRHHGDAGMHRRHSTHHPLGHRPSRGSLRCLCHQYAPSRWTFLHKTDKRFLPQYCVVRS